MPTASDLVTDLPADFETFGQAVATSMADLLGGTTGQVLSKASNTDMDFTWVTSDDANAIQNTIVDAKGDLIAASAADTPARLAVGANGETLVADSSTSTGLRYQTGVNTNTVINGGMDIWQRGTSGTFTGTVVYPAADRWAAVSTGTSATCTMSRQTADTTSQTYGLRFGRNSGQTNTGAPYIATAIESQQSRLYAGQTVTLSFYAKAGANAPLTLTTLLRTGTGTDQTVAAMFSTGWTGGVNVDTNHTVTTTMARYSVTTTLGSTVNEIFIGFGYAPTGTAGANEWFQIEGVQLELGSVPTTFKRAGGTLQGELAACQRYYWRFTGGNGNYAAYGTGLAGSTTQCDVFVQFPTTMRIKPTTLDFSTLALGDGTATVSVSTLTVLRSNEMGATLAAGTTGLTQYRAHQLLNNNNSTTAYLGVTAEL
jgi:hypothetical protein